jgi:hypothetical protein
MMLILPWKRRNHLESRDGKTMGGCCFGYILDERELVCFINGRWVHHSSLHRFLNAWGFQNHSSTRRSVFKCQTPKSLPVINFLPRLSQLSPIQRLFHSNKLSYIPSSPSPPATSPSQITSNLISLEQIRMIAPSQLPETLHNSLLCSFPTRGIPEDGYSVH